MMTARTKRDELTKLITDEMNLKLALKALFRCSCPNTGSPEGLIKTLLCVHSIYMWVSAQNKQRAVLE